ncbi:MAG: T9SS type A sorting domain-containing protein [Saprospiraceae bacterium]|nr:T9SS type A sorting domain-containing protein [Saprospiraceae bacterium]
MRACAFFTFLAASLLSLPFIAFGQNSWQPLAGPKGITVQAIAATDNGKVYIVSDKRGVFRSSDDGESWEPFNMGITDNYYSQGHFATASNGKIYYCGGEKMYRLASSGNAWEEIEISNFESTSVIFTNPQGDLFAVETFGGIYRSTNNGSTFSLFVADASLEGWPGVYTFNGGGHNFASVSYGASGKIYRISDDGSEVVAVRNVSGTVNALTYDAASGRIIYGDYSGFFYSEDDGLTWTTKIIEPGSTTPSNIANVIIQPNGELLASTSFGFYSSSDHGDTWTTLGVPLNGYTGQISMAFNNGTKYVISSYCGNQNFLRSTDNWATWEDLSEKFSLPSVNSIYKDLQGNLYANTCKLYGIERSTDNGNTWAKFLLPNGETVGQIINNSLGHLFATSTSAGIYRSIDSGATWQEISPVDLLPYYDIQLAVSPQNELWVVSDYESYRSLDNGDSWITVTMPQNVFYITGLAFHPNGSLYISSEIGTGIYRTADAGLTWEHVGDFTQADIYSLHITSKGHIYFIMDDFINGNSGLFVSYDNLNNYQLVNGDYYPGLIVSDLEGDIFMNDWNNGIIYSEDDGASFQPFNTGLQNIQNLSALYIDADQYLYAGFQGDVIYKSALPTSEKNTVQGKIWFDENENCQYDAGELPLQGWLVKANGNGNQYVRSSGFDGNFTIGLSPGDFTIKPVFPNNLWENSCAPQGANVSFVGSGNTAQVEIPISAVTLCPLLTVDLSTPLLRRCFENSYTVKICNEGTANASNVTVDVNLDPYFIYESSTATLLSQNGTVYTFAVGDIDKFDCKTFKITIKVSCEAELGHTHCMEATLSQAPCSEVPLAATKECQANIGSFDPNDKRAFVAGLPEDEWVDPNTPLEYLIRFQNTGTDTAFTIVVEDQLSTWLDPATVRPGASSHPYTFEMTETGLMRFTFSDILLPDSNINEVASHGFVKFAVQQRANVPFGNYINNSAAIFFDFNEPVITNTVGLHIGDPTGTTERHQRYTVLAYPNPFENATTLTINGLDGERLGLRLFDARGVQLRQQTFLAPSVQLSREELLSGMYFFRIEKAGEIVGRGRLVVK